MGPGDSIEIQRLVDLPSRISTAADQRTQHTQSIHRVRSMLQTSGKLAPPRLPQGPEPPRRSFSHQPLPQPHYSNVHNGPMEPNFSIPIVEISRVSILPLLHIAPVVDLHQCLALYVGQECLPYRPPQLHSTCLHNAHQKNLVIRLFINYKSKSVEIPHHVTPLPPTPVVISPLHLHLVDPPTTTHRPMTHRDTSGLVRDYEQVPHRLADMGCQFYV
ncbi:putative Serine/threonine-protein kinase Genghis Khan-like 2 [Homarus americanus]|uniref:Putative Serine/threonine-protein kinase Genghis Khan-like 2 n=1 Tax=Homarus americanus TaxID=6706 RepID=A0A8J5N5V3_HOMAM|nr:putative Serine/threonine-protein kinase Genghis Khan-like 2 [Homarus americanus]